METWTRLADGTLRSPDGLRFVPESDACGDWRELAAKIAAGEAEIIDPE